MLEPDLLSIVALPEDDFLLCQYLQDWYGLKDLSAVVHFLLRDKLTEMANTIEYQRRYGVETKEVRE